MSNYDLSTNVHLIVVLCLYVIVGYVWIWIFTLSSRSGSDKIRWYDALIYIYSRIAYFSYNPYFLYLKISQFILSFKTKIFVRTDCIANIQFQNSTLFPVCLCMYDAQDIQYIQGQMHRYHDLFRFKIVG